MSEESQKITNSGGTSPVDFKAMFAELLDDAKRDILAHVQDSIEKVYADFDTWGTIYGQVFSVSFRVSRLQGLQPSGELGTGN